MGDSGKPHNVVLIGSTGHGKSTFGNFLVHGADLPVEVPFKTSEKMETCTKSPTQVLITEGVAHPINVIDTPGLNDENDLQQMIEVLKHLHTLGDITAVIFCLNFDQRGDVNIKNTMQYYKNLLLPVFNAHNLILVLTNVNADDFEASVEKDRLDKVLDERKQSCSKLFGISVEVCELVNSVIPSHRKEKVKSLVSKSFTEKGPKNIYVASLLARERILQIITKMVRVSIVDHEFPLPPILEKKRVGKLKMVHQLRQELVNAVTVESSERANVLQSINDIEDEITTMEDRIKPIQEKLYAKKGIQRTEPLYFYGDDIFFLGRIRNKQFTVPKTLLAKEYTVACQSWNCNFQIVKQDRGIVTLDIVPDLMSVMRKGASPAPAPVVPSAPKPASAQSDGITGQAEQIVGQVVDNIQSTFQNIVTGFNTEGKRWWIIVWAEFSGLLAYPEDVSKLEREFLAEMNQLKKYQKILEEKKAKDSDLDKKLVLHKSRLDTLAKQTNLLTHQLFNLNIIEEVVALLQN